MSAHSTPGPGHSGLCKSKQLAERDEHKARGRLQTSGNIQEPSEKILLVYG